MKPFVAGLSYRTAPVAVRERLAVSPRLLPCHGCRLKVGAQLEEVVLLSTCNRVEVYGTSGWPGGRALRIFQCLGGDESLAPYLYVKEGEEAVRHLFAVAAGLDSMVVGETEITGQVKSAYETARAAGLTGPVTNRLFQTALQVAKEIRTRTQIGRGAVSVGSVAVELAEKIFDGDLSDRTVMIIGAGKMGEACVRHLTARGARSVLVANRSPERAQRLAAEFGGRALRMDECLEAMATADIVVCSTGSPHVILRRADVARVMSARKSRPLVMIDIAVPRDIDPEVEHLENVYLCNIDHLEAVVRENLRLREQELGRCREIIAARATEFLDKLARAAKYRGRAGVAPAGAWAEAGVLSKTGAVCAV